MMKSGDDGNTSKRAEECKNASVYLETVTEQVLRGFLEKKVWRLTDLPRLTVLTLKSVTTVKGRFGPYPIVKCDFKGYENVEMALPARYIEKLDGREFPLLGVYTGTVQYAQDGKTTPILQLVDMLRVQDQSMKMDLKKCPECFTVWERELGCDC